MPLLVDHQRSDRWTAERENRITASIAAACLGLDPYCSRQRAWRKILGTDVDHGNRHTRWGNEFEPKAREAYEVETGHLVSETGFWVHPVHSWLGASPDGEVGTDGLVEIKCPGKLPENVSLVHRIQMIVQLICTERSWCDYFAWTHEGHFLKRVHLAGAGGLIRRLAEFREKYVLTGVEPPRKARKKK